MPDLHSPFDIVKLAEQTFTAQHPEWETREQMTARLNTVKAQLAAEQAQLPDLRLEMRVTIDSHIDACYRQIRDLNAGAQIAAGELMSEFLAEEISTYNDALDHIKYLESDVEDIQRDLDDEDLWKD